MERHTIRASTIVPAPSSDETRSSPPSPWIRSLMLTRPKPDPRAFSASKPTPSSLIRRKSPFPLLSSTWTRSACPWRAAFVERLADDAQEGCLGLGNGPEPGYHVERQARSLTGRDRLRRLDDGGRKVVPGADREGGDREATLLQRSLGRFRQGLQTGVLPRRRRESRREECELLGKPVVIFPCEATPFVGDSGFRNRLWYASRRWTTAPERTR